MFSSRFLQDQADSPPPYEHYVSITPSLKVRSPIRSLSLKGRPALLKQQNSTILPKEQDYFQVTYIEPRYASSSVKVNRREGSNIPPYKRRSTTTVLPASFKEQNDPYSTLVPLDQIEITKQQILSSLPRKRLSFKQKRSSSSQNSKLAPLIEQEKKTITGNLNKISHKIQKWKNKLNRLSYESEKLSVQARQGLNQEEILANLKYLNQRLVGLLVDTQSPQCLRSENMAHIQAAQYVDIAKLLKLEYEARFPEICFQISRKNGFAMIGKYGIKNVTPVDQKQIFSELRTLKVHSDKTQFEPKIIVAIREQLSMIEKNSNISSTLKTLLSVKENTLILYSFHKENFTQAKDFLDSELLKFNQRKFYILKALSDEDKLKLAQVLKFQTDFVFYTKEAWVESVHILDIEKVEIMSQEKLWAVKNEDILDESKFTFFIFTSFFEKFKIKEELKRLHQIQGLQAPIDQSDERILNLKKSEAEYSFFQEFLLCQKICGRIRNANMHLVQMAQQDNQLTNQDAFSKLNSYTKNICELAEQTKLTLNYENGEISENGLQTYKDCKEKYEEKYGIRLELKETQNQVEVRVFGNYKKQNLKSFLEIEIAGILRGADSKFGNEKQTITYTAKDELQFEAMLIKAENVECECCDFEYPNLHFSTELRNLESLKWKLDSIFPLEVLENKQIVRGLQEIPQISQHLISNEYVRSSLELVETQKGLQLAVKIVSYLKEKLLQTKDRYDRMIQHELIFIHSLPLSSHLSALISYLKSSPLQFQKFPIFRGILHSLNKIYLASSERGQFTGTYQEFEEFKRQVKEIDSSLIEFSIPVESSAFRASLMIRDKSGISFLQELSERTQVIYIENELKIQCYSLSRTHEQEFKTRIKGRKVKTVELKLKIPRTHHHLDNKSYLQQNEPIYLEERNSVVIRNDEKYTIYFRTQFALIRSIIYLEEKLKTTSQKHELDLQNSRQYSQVFFPFNKQELLKAWVDKYQNLKQDYSLFAAHGEIGNKNIVLVEQKYYLEYCKAIRELDKYPLYYQAQFYSHFVMTYLQSLIRKKNYNFTIIQKQSNETYFEEAQGLARPKLCVDPVLQLNQEEAKKIGGKQRRLLLPREHELEWRKECGQNQALVRPRYSRLTIIFSVKERPAVEQFFKQMEGNLRFQEVRLEECELECIPDVDVIEIENQLGIRIVRKQQNHYYLISPVYVSEEFSPETQIKRIQKSIDKRGRGQIPLFWPILSMKRYGQLSRQIKVESSSFLKFIKSEEIPPTLSILNPRKVFNLPLYYNLLRSLAFYPTQHAIQFYLVGQEKCLSGIGQSQNLRLEYPPKSASSPSSDLDFVASLNIKSALEMAASKPGSVLVVCEGVQSEDKKLPTSRLVLAQQRDNEEKKYEGSVQEESQVWMLENTHFTVIGIASVEAAN